MDLKKRKVIANLFAGMVGFGLGLILVSLFLGVVSSMGADEKTGDLTRMSVSLFADDWGDYDLSPVLIMMSFFVTIVGIVLMVVALSLRSKGKKFIKPMHIAGIAASGAGGILILISGILLKNDFYNVMEKMLANISGVPVGSATLTAAMNELGIQLGTGVIFGCIAGVVACIGGGLLLLKNFDPIITAKNQPVQQPIPQAAAPEQPAQPEQPAAPAEEPAPEQPAEEPVAESAPNSDENL